LKIINFKKEFDCFLGEVLNEMGEVLKRRYELRFRDDSSKPYWGDNGDAYVFMPFSSISDKRFSRAIFSLRPDRRLTAG